MSSHLLGVAFALMSALVWGSGDFSGGLATRRHNQFGVLVLSALSGMAVLLLFAGIWGEAWPRGLDVVRSLAAGGAGAVGLASLYRALSLERASGVAPTAAVVGAVLPVVFGLATEGLPATNQMAGFALAVPGLWLVTRPSGGNAAVSRRGFFLAVLAGVGFGGFFILIAQVEGPLVFTPLILTRSATLLAGLALAGWRRAAVPSPGGNPVAVLAGVLDAGGNVFYLLAQQFTRLDAAAVLASLYPATTILLAQIVLRERVARTQWIGVGLCLLTVALIAL